jgi:predicted nucleic acid-binding protein
VREAFADTFFFLAVGNAEDSAHAKSVAAYRDRSFRFVTTAWVLTELGDALGVPGLRDRFAVLLDTLSDDPNAVVLEARQDIFMAGVELYRTRPDKEWSLTDCISFAVMEQRGITDALTGDHHFEQAGFRALLK